ncbi:MAG: hypothetical protein Q7U33_07670 [Methylotenera sp.]|uniref:hypothetical protein n=1 Tax=Methylotenera sp. TaxID=2051956 RepID=UPI00271BBCDE|nr:hypothetical protein [Methylotenera sp.]MDO9151238.1 hypothetical protein [Methylotenera sp.]
MRLFIPLILAIYANASFALSIGDATLKSYLGEPLIVKLNVTDVEKSPDSNCFTITDTNDTSAFRKALSTLVPYKNGYQLTITTQSVITEPIVSLRVSYGCEPQLIRDYVLLLDPAPYHSEMLTNTGNSTQTSGISKQPEKAIDNVNTVSPYNNKTTVDSINDSTSKPQASTKRNSKKRLANSPSTTDQKIMEAYVGKQQSSAKPTPATSNSSNSELAAPTKPSSSSEPYLSISGGNQVTNALGGQTNLGLKFEREIDLNRTQPIAPMDSSEMMDEVTVMTNRLTHLEKQIISLQAQNTELRNEATLAKAELENQKSSWLDYFFIAMGVALLIAILTWLHRTFISKRLIKQEPSWLDAEHTEFGEDEPTFSTTTIQPALDNKQTRNNNFSASFLDDQPYDDQEKMALPRPSTLSFTEHVIDEHDSIIDNADVFIEHERPLLAIQLLQNHLNDFPTESPKIWLKLLSLIETEGTEAEYEAAAIEAKKYFNIRVPNYSDAKSEDTSSIEDFSNIVARLEGVWGSPFAVKFLNDLIYDHHAQPAEGFSAKNFEELFFLKRIAELLSTGVTTSQRTLYRSAPAISDSEVENTPTDTSLDNLAFNEAAFGNNMPFDQVSPAEFTEDPSKSAIIDDEFMSASFLDTPEPTKLNKLTKEEAHSQFENSPFQKVPSYDVDMLVDFDDHIETDAQPLVVPVLKDEADDMDISQDIKQDILEKDDVNQEMAEEFHFPLDTYPEETDSKDNTPTEIDEKPTPKKGKDSNIIEWDLPKIDS